MSQLEQRLIWDQTKRHGSLRTQYNFINLITIVQNNRLRQSIIPTQHMYVVILYNVYVIDIS